MSASHYQRGHGRRSCEHQQWYPAKSCLHLLCVCGRPAWPQTRSPRSPHHFSSLWPGLSRASSAALGTARPLGSKDRMTQHPRPFSISWEFFPHLCLTLPPCVPSVMRCHHLRAKEGIRPYSYRLVFFLRLLTCAASERER